MKKILTLILALTMAVGLCACGGGEEAPAEDTAAETVTLKVAASPTPHAEILAQVVDVLAEQGIELVVTEYGDYVVPNTAVEEGAEDANFFQHAPYLESFNEENGTHLVSVAPIHYEPMGIYPGMTASLEELPDGATIAVPNDVTNEARALQLLAAQGLIEIDPAAGLNATPNDITSNPKNLQFKEMEAAMLPQIVGEVDLAIINSNFALQGGLNPAEDSLASEDAASEAAQTFANIIVVKEGNEENAAVLALIEALQSDAVREFIETTYAGSVVAMF
ncbi:MAG: MetQ/NlpA family ABC transporter substrate-binding protein [Ruminiclostridium sp.]|nr:MetQ/NlpA family ABC transporter substrate-binding protein [Ruminiclostridium sp.]